jgi:predicted alpha/beta-hydrolase family hydrolase
MAEVWSIPVDTESVSAAWDPPATPSSAGVFLCAPGAGGNFRDRSMLALSGVLTAQGLGVVRFNFVYRELGRRYPDPMPRLTACFTAVAASVRQKLAPDLLLVGGRSMGGRAASVAVAQGLNAGGLLLLAYPLHAPGKPDSLRDAHLAKITIPTLCFNGTRDAFCRRDLMENVIARLEPRWTMHWLDGADHGFHVLKRSGRTDEDVLHEVADATLAWISSLRKEKSVR